MGKPGAHRPAEGDHKSTQRWPLAANHASHTAELYAGPAVGADSGLHQEQLTGDQSGYVDTVPRLGSEPGTVFGQQRVISGEIKATER